MKYFLLICVGFLVGCTSSEVVSEPPRQVRYIDQPAMLNKKKIEYLRTSEKLEEFYFNPMVSAYDSSLRLDGGYAHRVLESSNWITDPRAPEIRHSHEPISGDNWEFQFKQEQESKLAKIRKQEQAAFVKGIQLSFKEKLIKKNEALVNKAIATNKDLTTKQKEQNTEIERLREQLKIAQEQSLRLLERIEEENQKKSSQRGLRR